MRRREASINDIAIADRDRRFLWPLGVRPPTTRACRTTRNPTVLDRLTASIRQKRSARVKKPVIERVGWGARIRTWEWRNQNPLPYHLATPQNARPAAGARET